MEESNATYKVGIRFENFLENGKSYSYPFGGSSDRRDIRTWPFLRKKFPEIFTTDKCHLWLAPESILMDENKISNSIYIEVRNKKIKAVICKRPFI